VFDPANLPVVAMLIVWVCIALYPIVYPDPRDERDRRRDERDRFWWLPRDNPWHPDFPPHKFAEFVAFGRKLFILALLMPVVSTGWKLLLAYLKTKVP